MDRRGTHTPLHGGRRSQGNRRSSGDRGREQYSSTSFRRRLLALCVVVSVIAAGLVYRMITLQGAGKDALVMSGVKQRLETYKVEAQRGTILDRNGVELAVSIPRRTIAVDMRRLTAAGVDDWVAFDSFAEEISPYADSPAPDIAERLKNAGPEDMYVVLARNVPTSSATDLVQKLQDEKRTDVLSALIVERSSERINPAGESALRVIGKLGPDGPAKMAGIERSFDKQLRGSDGENRVELKGGAGDKMAGWAAIVTGEGRIDLSRRRGALPDSERVIKEAMPGSAVQLTIDRTIQHDVERILIDGTANAGARRGIAVVGKPTTGELLAVASVEVDPETAEVGISDGPLAFSNAYQAGSVFKLVTVASGIEAGEVSTDTMMSVPDRLKVRNRSFSDHDKHPTQAMSVTDIVAHSSNVGTIMIAQKLGKERLYDSLLNFGFGARTGVSHPAEAAGTVPPYQEWTDPDLAASSIGTHQSATALQLWAAYNVVANKGMYVQPRLVESVIHPDGAREAPPTSAPRRVVSVETASSLSNVLQSVVTEGTAKQWTLPGYSVAAKTGTSRMASPKLVDKSDGYMWEDGHYHYLAAFTGFLPADRPQVSITVILDDVNAGLYGSTAAGPIFSQLARLSIRELGIAPDESGDTGDQTALLPGTTRGEDGRIRTSPAARPGPEETPEDP